MIKRMNIPMGNEELTIVSEYESLRVEEGRKKWARLEWQAPGLDIYVRGPLTGTLYESAANLALNIAISRHIPAISVRKVVKSNG